MIDEPKTESKALVDWQEVIGWAHGVGETLAYWDEVTADLDSEDERERRHRDALASYNRWQADRKRRLAEYDARVDAYHASLDEALAHIEARDRAEHADLLRARRLVA